MIAMPNGEVLSSAFTLRTVKLWGRFTFRQTEDMCSHIYLHCFLGGSYMNNILMQQLSQLVHWE